MKGLIGAIIEKILLSIPWPEVAAEAWVFTKKVFHGYANEGMVEVISLDSKLEILNVKGTRAIFSKTKHVRFLQNETFAFLDYAWGDGEILIDYQCKPGKVVDQYRQGFKTYLLISLGETKSRGEEIVFDIQWRIKRGFLASTGFWETDISEKTQNVSVTIVFPKERHPRKVEVVETYQKRTTEIPHKQFEVLPTGQVKIIWERKNPRLYENYLVRWIW